MTTSSLSRFRLENAEVLYADTSITAVDRAVVDALAERSTHNPRRRIRLCAHPNPADRLHEMLIVHARGAYVRPHRHPGKSESMHVIDGAADLVVFDDNGDVQTVTPLGPYASGRTFYHRMAAPLFHTLLVRSDIFVFHETTNGPFDRSETVFASWTPEDADSDGTHRYLENLKNRIEHLR